MTESCDVVHFSSLCLDQSFCLGVQQHGGRAGVQQRQLCSRLLEAGQQCSSSHSQQQQLRPAAALLQKAEPAFPASAAASSSDAMQQQQQQQAPPRLLPGNRAIHHHLPRTTGSASDARCFALLKTALQQHQQSWRDSSRQLVETASAPKSCLTDRWPYSWPAPSNPAWGKTGILQHFVCGQNTPRLTSAKKLLKICLI